MPKVVVDTNVLLSGILFGGNPRKIITAWLGKQYVLCISPELKAEIIDKLRSKFDLPLTTVEIIEDALDLYSEKYIPGKKVNLCRDPNDNFLLELALESRADYLVSGDKLVLELKQYKSTKIITPKEFLRILQ
ncbi:putative toxin-antitoxin system toxin component, PIN family [Candidatus Curtissbacteria bacterium RIFCSPHIGHO2_01_FULL_41_44]|uniref:Putative toxin-antitoxin system toxin component, PIN family n=1 Tax=Candidatus Curtissbacteria bacterium RIFCSPLOWO2_01_FULL_42_50 TaxID=1797730 RepID=A0A1F5H5C2_9BACT|nr:MAG: putative toxin-antitoxin system toxin component, PIN family [Candidatus Curtissbacteria bacterium RIFCSPHIGHO2_02_FULL_42_58]OGD93450.1 MAG: putative toxin-antitoxin system toxin component, PIN family [Candidatus Curtissbacteria bacterium RIFCSPHIGHO2_01_FULL_41_44]OGD96711.1 MAG: putative toxin-antitoxin system toxin component, PIN family [Candidatus Curtissbacteria bacterium RIFCSPHIGHO2_12_FULL_42_33]OGD99366.1 MAG: putative toxin-antitoxin system toxin component, PIN family [Candidat